MARNSEMHAVAAAWTGGLFDTLRIETDRATRIIRDAPLTEGDVAAADRHCRAIFNVVRAAKAVCTLLPAPADTPDEESDDDVDDDPEELVRAHAELQSRLDRLRATVEAKRLAGWHVVGQPGSPGGEGDL